MSKSVVLPDDIYEKAAELARADKVSISDFVSAALADQLAAREYLAKRASHPDVEPDDYDRL